MDTVQNLDELRQRIRNWRSAGEKIALVPTMGALHEGHLSLVRLAREKAARTVVSIFVNPKQFAPNEDFATYPRDEEGDLEKLRGLGTDLVYIPEPGSVYADGFSTTVHVDSVSEGLCAVSRPHFFDGVATVVAKLFTRVQPDIAIFGEKDYQQLLVIRRMADDLDLNVEVLGGRIIREPDGLAMSSRNLYLSEEARKKAAIFPQTLSAIAGDAASGEPLGPLIDRALKTLENAGFGLDYIEVRDGETLRPLETVGDRPARVFGAVVLDGTRLIDNWPVV